MSKKNKQPEAINLDMKQGYDSAHQSMFSKMGNFTAYGERMLVTDDELPLYKHIQLYAVCLAFFGFIIWANWANLDEVTRGEGKVIPTSEIQQIQHQEGGTIEKFFVKEGDNVTKGQVLIQLSDVGAASDLGASTSKLMSLRAQKARLEAEKEGLATPDFPEDVFDAAPESVQEELNTFRANQSALKSQLRVLQAQSSQRRQEVSEINSRIRDTQRLISLTHEEISMMRPLVQRGSAPKRDMLELERTLTQQETELNGMRASLPRANSAIREVNARISELKQTAKTEAQNELASVLSEIKILEKGMGRLVDTQDRTEITSPVDGIVKDLRINTVGGVIKPGDLIAEIVPNDEQLLVEANIRPSDIAFIHPGQKTTVKITAYDFSIYGGLVGEVVDISADSITNEKGESFYRVKVQTHDSTLKRKGEILPIIPGMVASVDILTGEKTIMQYILKPFRKTLDNAMHER